MTRHRGAWLQPPLPEPRPGAEVIAPKAASLGPHTRYLCSSGTGPPSARNRLAARGNLRPTSTSGHPRAPCHERDPSRPPLSRTTARRFPRSHPAPLAGQEQGQGPAAVGACRGAAGGGAGAVAAACLGRPSAGGADIGRTAAQRRDSGGQRRGAGRVLLPCWRASACPERPGRVSEGSRQRVRRHGGRRRAGAGGGAGGRCAVRNRGARRTRPQR